MWVEVKIKTLTLVAGPGRVNENRWCASRAGRLIDQVRHSWYSYFHPENRPMKFSAAVVFTIICVLVASFVLADGGAPKAKTRCVPSAPSVKPFLAYVEDGLALALDVPLAMLSPIFCPILAPIIDRLGPSDARSYHRSGTRR